jgi:hypothetical protein
MGEGVKDRANILEVLRRSKVALNNKDVFLLKNLSNHTIHSAAIYQDVDSISIAVIIYALSKIIERPKYSFYKEWPSFVKLVNSNFDEAIYTLEQEDSSSFRKSITNMRKTISKISGDLRKYIDEVFRKAEINKASRIYEHGISLGQTASILGLSLFELSEYAGRTGIPDVSLSITMPFEDRFKRAWEFFEK